MRDNLKCCVPIIYLHCSGIALPVAPKMPRNDQGCIRCCFYLRLCVFIHTYKYRATHASRLRNWPTPFEPIYRCLGTPLGCPHGAAGGHGGHGGHAADGPEEIHPEELQYDAEERLMRHLSARRIQGTARTRNARKEVDKKRASRKTMPAQDEHGHANPATIRYWTPAPMVHVHHHGILPTPPCV